MPARYWIIFAIVVLSFHARNTYSQQVTVIDRSSGELVDRVVLYNQDKSISTITDNYGKASLVSFRDADSVYFQHPSYVISGFLKHELVYGNGQVELEKRNIMMEEFVISAVKGMESRSETPYMINVLDPELLTTSGFQNSADILQSTGNVMVQKSQGGGGSPILRGFEANKVLLVVDGVRMNNAIYRSGHLQNAITIDNNILERVEVLFGPSSIMYGSDALGGVVHYYTLKPELNKMSGSFYSQFSSANQGMVFHGDFSIGGRKISNLSSFTYSDFGDIRSGMVRKDEWGDWGLLTHFASRVGGVDSTLANSTPEVQKKTGYRQYDFVNKTRYEVSSVLELLLNLQLSTSSDIDRFDQLNDYQEDGNLKYAEWHYGPQSRFLGSAQAVLKNYNRFYTNATATIAFQKIREDRITRRFRIEDRLFQEEDVYVYSGNVDFTKVLSEGRRFFYGIEITHNDVNSEARWENIRTGARSPAPTRYPGGGSHTNSFAAYGNYKLKPSEKLILSMGLRYQHSTLNSRLDDPNLTFDRIKMNKGAPTASLSLVYTPAETWQYDFILATGFRTPNVDDVGKVRAKGDFITVPNENLNPEYTYNAEIGISKVIPGIMSLSSSVYFTYLTNAIVRTDYSLNGSDSLFYDGDYYRIITNSNASLATIQGISITSRSDLPGNLSFMGTFNYLKGNDITNEVPLGHIPPVFGKLSASHRFQPSGSTAGRLLTNELFIHYSGRKYWSEMTPFGEDNEDEALEGYGYPAWYTINLRSHYRISERFEIQLSIENILNRFYKTFASAPGAPGRNFIFTFRASI